jgi:hypothetical protein
MQGSVLVNRLQQSNFARASFDSGRFNLHNGTQNAAKPARTVVVLVHGLSGRGYGTWGLIPERLFAGSNGPAVDVGVYEVTCSMTFRMDKPDAITSPLVAYVEMLGQTPPLSDIDTYPEPAADVTVPLRDAP